MDKEEARNRFWYGTHYLRLPTPLESEWHDDLEHIKDIGLSIIQCRVFWACHERTEGDYTWDEIDKFMDLAAAKGLTVVLQLSLENAPSYIFKKYDGYRIDIRGHRIWPIAHAAFYPGGWIPCFDNPDVMGRALAFVEKLVLRYKKHPAMELWHAWNEPRSRPMGECACGYSLETYRKWLRERYGTIEALNAKFGKYYADFDTVDVARDTSDFVEMYLWRLWGASRVYGRVKSVVDCIRGLDSKHTVISHAGLNCMQQDPLCDISDDAMMADVADMYGSSYEVRYYKEPLMHSLPFLICDWMRSITDGNYTIYELYPSKGRFEKEIPAFQFQQWMWIPIACGARSTFLWQFKKERLGVEINEAGLVETDGSDNPTSLNAKMQFGHYKRLRKDIESWRVPKAKIAIMYDLDSDLINRLTQTAGRCEDYSGQYKLRRPLLYGTHSYKANFQGVYHLFWENNFQVDVVSSRKFDDCLKKYDVLYMPSLQVVGREKAEKLIQFVARGGKLIVDGGFAERDDNSWLHVVRPSKILADRFSYREGSQVIDPSLKDEAIYDNLTLPVVYQTLSLQCNSAIPVGIWKDGGTSILTRNLGKGEVLVLGFMPGLSYFETNDSAWIEFFERIIINWADVKTPWWTENRPDPRITVRRLIDTDGKDVDMVFRKWGVAGRMSDEEWISIGNNNTLFTASHCKCLK